MRRCLRIVFRLFKVPYPLPKLCNLHQISLPLSVRCCDKMAGITSTMKPNPMHLLFLVVVSIAFAQSFGVRRGTAFDMAVVPPSPSPKSCPDLLVSVAALPSIWLFNHHNLFPDPWTEHARCVVQAVAPFPFRFSAMSLPKLLVSVAALRLI